MMSGESSSVPGTVGAASSAKPVTQMSFLDKPDMQEIESTAC